MREPLGPRDTPEIYAVEYIESEEHVALFEKLKLIHDECLEKNLKCLLIVESPTRKEQPIGLYHIHNKVGENEKIWAGFQWLAHWINSFLRGMTGGHYIVSTVSKNI